MGCWNGTCGITNLPIRAGEKVVFLLIALRANNEANTYCYSTGWGYPVSLPIRAVYNDYGGVEDIANNAVSNILAKTRSNLFKTAMTERGITMPKYNKDQLPEDKMELENWLNDVVNSDEHEINFDNHKSYRDSSLAQLIDLIQQKCGHEPMIKLPEDIKKSYWDSEKTIQEMIDEEIKKTAATIKWCQPDRVGLWMCHEWAWNQITKSPEAVNGWWSMDKEEQRLDIRTRLKNAYNETVKFYKDKAEDDEFYRKYMHPLNKYSSDNDFARITSSHRDEGPNSLSMEPYREAINEIAKTGVGFTKSKELKSIVDAVIELYVAMASMGALRRGWVPQPGAGSQCEKYGLHHSLLEAAAKKAKTRMKTGYEW